MTIRYFITNKNVFNNINMLMNNIFLVTNHLKEKIAKRNNVNTKIAYENSSDHASFNLLDIDSLSFCHSDLSKIHTPNDTVDYISIKAINEAYTVIEDKIFDSSYSIVTKFFYSKTSIYIFSFLFGFLVSAPFITHLKKCKINNVKFRIKE